MTIPTEPIGSTPPRSSCSIEAPRKTRFPIVGIALAEKALGSR